MPGLERAALSTGTSSSTVDPSEVFAMSPRLYDRDPVAFGRVCASRNTRKWRPGAWRRPGPRGLAAAPVAPGEEAAAPTRTPRGEGVGGGDAEVSAVTAGIGLFARGLLGARNARPSNCSAQALAYRPYELVLMDAGEGVDRRGPGGGGDGCVCVCVCVSRVCASVCVWYLRVCVCIRAYCHIHTGTLGRQAGTHAHTHTYTHTDFIKFQTTTEVTVQWQDMHT